jgi:2'-hydroxyisoflavone reductase
MDILIIGGTVFLGRALVDAALARGHQVTLFNRGKSRPDVYPQVEQIHGDRETDLNLLNGRSWDAVVDTCGYFPRIVRLSASQLAGKAHTYVFVSSISVYDGTPHPGIDESWPVGKLEDESIEKIDGGSYGPLKALCEQAVSEVFGPNALIVRPGLIVGPHDPSDRFTYWPWRFTQDGPILAPGRPERLIQWIDVRDLAEWMITALEEKLSGIYNADGPAGMCTMDDLLRACQAETAPNSIAWAGDDFLLAESVGAWMEMPLWIPENDPDAPGFFMINTRKAMDEGLKMRPLRETVRAVLDWLPERGERPWKAGLTRERESTLLAKL